MSNPEGFPHLN